MKKLFLILFLFFPLTSFATQMITDTSKEGLLLAVVQDEFRFDFSNIKAASLIYNDDQTFKGLLIELKPAAVASLTKMTRDGFNKEMMVVFNNKIVSASILKSPLGGQVLFSSISLSDAQIFLMMLTEMKKEQNHQRDEALGRV